MNDPHRSSHVVRFSIQIIAKLQRDLRTKLFRHAFCFHELPLSPDQLLVGSTYAITPGLRFRRGAPELPIGQPSTADTLLLDTRARSSTFLRPLPVLQLLPEFGRQTFFVQGQTVADVPRGKDTRRIALQAFPFQQLPVEFGAEFLPQRLIISECFRSTMIGTCNGFTEILDAFATAASSARICVYNEDILCKCQR